MKKGLSLMLAVLFLFVCGCRNESNGPTGISLEEFQTQAIVMPQAVHADTPITPQPMPETLDCIGILEKTDTVYYGSKGFEVEDGLDYVETVVTLEPYKEIPVKYPEGLDKWSVGSGSWVVMDNRYYYQWNSHNDAFGLGEVHAMKLTCVDLVTGEMTVFDEMELIRPLVYLYKLDDTHFLSCYAIPVESDKGAQHASVNVATVYDTDGSKKEIIREVYEDDPEWTDSVGRLIECFAVKDGEIYGFGRRRIDSQNVFNLYHYNREGELLDTEAVPGIGDILGDETPVELHLLGDYVVYRSYQDGTVYVLKRTKNGMRYLAKGGKYAILHSDKGDYIFYIESTVNDDATLKEKDCPLYIINTHTNEVVSYTLQLPLENAYFVSMVIPDSKELVLSYCEGTYNPLKVKKFIVTKAELQKMLP